MPAMAPPGQESDSKQVLEAQLRATLEVIPAYTWYALPSGALSFVNKRHADYLGLPKDHPLRFGNATGAEWDSHTALLHPEDREEARRVWSICLSTGTAGEFTFRVPSAEGKYRWFLTRAEPLRANDGALLYWIGVNLDIDDAKRAEEALRKSEKELRDVIDTIPAIVWSALPDGSNTYVNKRYVEYTGSSAEQVAGSGWEALIHPDDLERHAAKWMEAVATGKPHESEVRSRRSDGQYRWQLDRGVPLRDEDGNIVKWYGVTTDIEDRKRTEEALKRSEAYLAGAQRLSHTGSFGWKPDTGEIVWSEETYRIFEYDRSVTPTIDSLMQRVHPQDRAELQKVIDGASRGAKDFEHTYRFLLPDGRVKHLHTIAHATRDKSGRLEYVGAAQDVTQQQLAEDQRKEAAEALQASERDLRSIIRTIPTMVWSSAPDGSVDFNFFNPRWLDYTGLPPDQTRDWRWTAAIHPDDLRQLTDAWRSILVSGEPGETEARLRRLDGVYRWFLFRANPLRNESGSIVKWYGILFDIEERKRAEEELRRSEMELQQMLDLVPQHVAVFGPNNERLYANHVALDYIGISLGEWRQTNVGVFPTGWFIHPDDSERVKACWDRALASGSVFEVELRLRKHDGSYRWFLSRYNPVRDDKGQIMRWYVAGTDIEDRKRAEEGLRQENVALREEIDKASMFEEIVGTSPALQTVLSHISIVAPSDSTVLITGETGTGKELVARAIHRRSNRASRAFVSVNCAAIPLDLIASELFGHEKGAFTGATQQRLGRFELANGGTLFLDEVGELPAETQIALLRVLQEHEFERVGGTRPIHADVRVIAATNRDLEATITAGSFRSDLYYRLNVFPIEVPALRERKQDIPLLVEYFIDRYARRAGKRISTVDKKTLRLLESYPWPGNIRELQNVIERSIIVCETPSFSVDESWLSHQSPDRKAESQLFLSEKVAAQEKEIIEAALRESQGRVFGPSGAAVKLGMPRSTLESKIRSFKIDKNRFKTPSGT